MRWAAIGAFAAAGIVATAAPALALAPSAPSITYLHGGPGVGQMTIKWSAPTSDGGVAITSYEYEYAVDGGTWNAGATTFPSTARKAVVACPAPLSPGHGCSFHVRANNGTAGPWSAAHSAVWAKPTAPGLSSAVAGPAVGQARLRWKPPLSNGGLAITEYDYAVYDGVSWSAPVAILPSAITTLKTSPKPLYSTLVPCSITTAGGPAGCKYRMYALNAVGLSPASSALTAKLTAPSTALNLKALTNSVALGTGASTQTISWDAPASTGGLAITHTTLFACTTSQGSNCKDYSAAWTFVADYAGSPSSVSTTWTCPANGRCGYEVQVFNDLGASFVVAHSRPAPPTMMNLTPSTAVAGSVDVSWTGTIDNGGATFGHYVLFECSVANDCTSGNWTSNPADTAAWTATILKGTATTTSFACGITTACRFQVGYIDANGRLGGVSNAAAAVGLDAPTLTATANGSPGSIDLTWTPPSTTETITGYEIERDTGTGFSQLTLVGGAATSYTDNTCPPGTSCGYRVTALYTVGTSAVSTAQYATSAP